jgi:peptide subunit release factor 1 (eRF1)
MEEEVDAKNVFTTVGWRELTISPSTAAPSGGSASDVFERRIEAQTLRFYRELGETVRGLIERFGLVRLILAGPEERTSTFLRTLPGQTARMVAATVPLRLGASESEVMRRVSVAEDLAQRERQEALLAEFSDSQSCPYCGSRTRERELVDAVLELAQARGTRMEFLRGESADLLREGFGGLAGLVRF